MRLAMLRFVLGLMPLALASFSFTVDSTTPASCGTVKLAWTGGTAPFGITIVPAFDYPQNISLPDSAFSNGVGSYSWQADYPSGTQLVIMMSDATGHGCVDELSNEIYCDRLLVSFSAPNQPSAESRFYLNETAVDQCGPVQIYWDKSAVQPVTIIGVIPGGQPFVFTSSGGSSSLVWNTNIAAGTQFILAAFDEGPTGIGGSSSLMTVDGSSNSACLDDSSPSSTPVAAPSSTKTSSSNGGGVIKTVTAIATVAPDTAGSKISTGAIVGIVLGAILGFAILQLLVFWWCCRRQLAALLSHRKEMRGREVKHSGDMDLVSQHRRSLVAVDDGGESSAPDSRRTSLLWNAAGTGASLGGATRMGRSRSSQDDRIDRESAISPFWDHPSSTESPRGHSRHLSSGTATRTDTGTGTDLLPPMLPHLRTDSLSSMLSMPLSLSHEENTSVFDGLPYLATSTLSPSSPSSPSLSHTYPRSPSAPTPSLTPSPAPPTPGTSRPPPRQTKAQLAASMSTTNPDPRRNRRSRDLEGERQPRLEAPEGGFRLHEDAGRVDEEGGGQADVEDLPPIYRPEWETESQRRQPRH